MLVEIKAPSPGESISQVLLANWLVENNAVVEQDAEIAEIESDKATLMIYAPASGMLHILAGEGEMVSVNAVIATIDTSAAAGSSVSQKTSIPQKSAEEVTAAAGKKSEKTFITPLAKNIIGSRHIADDQIRMLGKRRISSRDVLALAEQQPSPQKDQRPEKRVKMSPLRTKLAERLVSVKNETAMLTTFNEVDMSTILKVRADFGNAFLEKHGVKLGFIGFFVKACAMALREFPMINARIDGDEIVYPGYEDICIAVSTPKGLLAPAIREAGEMPLPEIEALIRDFAVRAGENKIGLDELAGGTFTISNGGVFGSMLSTPIINPPQSAILGMHKIQERPVVVSGSVVIRPMMHVALSYDHRLIDGKESVGFVVRIKELVENPLLLSGDTEARVEDLLRV